MVTTFSLSHNKKKTRLIWGWEMPPASKNAAAAAASGAAGDGLKHQTSGAIVRVSMKNFVTYKDVEVQPGDDVDDDFLASGFPFSRTSSTA